ncbi:GntR family transcriptional regulator [Bacillus sp. 165]|uniref:GntR family transcriptional regulator n=1 Tax=Bacillus sp. 165 TaxID=1529117 RepID=UPI001ADA0685|nr:GntR family transcriptional regulator [Bacillus sp. 165]MBO9129390.1 GntR family transcriptional regulator [Bacillus sp. 165]
MENEKLIFKGVKPDTRNLNERIYTYLHNKIIFNQLKPGTRISYEELIEELGVSKTPLRDALNRLQQDGLIEIKPRSGTFVKMPNAKDIEEIFDVRKALERQAVGLATTRMPRDVMEQLLEKTILAEKVILSGDFNRYLQIDHEMHKVIFLNSDNQRLIHILNSLQAQVTWIGVMIGNAVEGLLEVNEHHKSILRAMLDSDAVLAQNLMENHIEEVKSTALKSFL